MVIFITGASGFIGRRLTQAFVKLGHTVHAAGRAHVPATTYVAADFTHDFDASDWEARLRGVDVVINTVGILRESATHTFEAVHTRAPQALFRACAAAGVRRVIQVSALGAESGSSGYFRSKRAADDCLRELPLDWTIVRPALVYGPGGASARLFTTLASLPLIAVPGRGDQPLQPIHIDDLVEAIVAICTQSLAIREVVPLVGSSPLTFADLLLTLRAAQGLPRTLLLRVPMGAMRVVARIAELSPRPLLDRDTLAMLAAGNVADPAATHRTLGRSPRSVASFIPTEARSAIRRETQLRWLLPMLRASIALVWLWTAVVSFGLYPRESSFELLVRAGVSAELAPLMLYGAAGFDLALGVATLLMKQRRWLWMLQIVLIIGYTLIISVKLPEYWLHPYGPVLKNLPMLAALYLLYVLEER